MRQLSSYLCPVSLFLQLGTESDCVCLVQPVLLFNVACGSLCANEAYHDERECNREKREVNSWKVGLAIVSLTWEGAEEVASGGASMQPSPAMQAARGLRE